MIDTPLIKQMRELASSIQREFDSYLVRYEDPRYDEVIKNDGFEGWEDTFWSGPGVHKAHLKIIEPDTGGKNRKLWLMHMNVFPSKHIDVPIFGLDIVATPNKISGCFCDYSPTNDSSIQKEYMDFFENITTDLEWKRERELPPWAQEIFSENMIAAGAVKEGEEADQLCIVANTLTDFYMRLLSNEKPIEGLDTTEAQNKYCINQKINKMLHTSILAMGVEEGPKNDYVNNMLFEEI